MKSLSTIGLTADDHIAAINELSKQEPMTPETSRLLRRVLNAPGYNLVVRKTAFNSLAVHDRKALIETMQTTIGRSESYEFRRWVLETIGERKEKDFTIVVVNSWAAAVPAWGSNDLERPEYAAMKQLYGGTENDVVDALFAVLMESSPVTQAALRARTWELLMRIGQRERLAELVASTAYRPDDVMLRDIRQLSVDLGILPETREELLWLGKLRQSASPAFWAMAGDALKQLNDSERRKFELRGIPVAIAAMKYKPELLKRSTEELYQQVAAQLKTRDAGKYSANFEGYEQGRTESLGLQREKLGWIDLAAMMLALDMADRPAVRATLFNIGDRDQQDRSTEYGGIIRLTDTGEYEVVEVRPRSTGSDLRYEAPQEAFDLGYTALFHFHFHAQEYDNARYAGPHLGDFGYANATRANCLVFAYVKRNLLDMDYYRHGPVTIDLGTMTRD